MQKIFENCAKFTGNTCVSHFFNKFVDLAGNFIKKVTLTWLRFPANFKEIFRENFFYRKLPGQHASDTETTYMGNYSLGTFTSNP